MREGSLSPFGLGFSPRQLVRRTLGRLASRLGSGERSEFPPDSDARAAAVLREHETTHAALFERMMRLTEKVRRLEEVGTPSESARNRAARARDEVADELALLRASFAAEAGEEGLRALDRQLRCRYPGLELPETGRQPG
jgi:hypothetical protein